MSASAQSTSLPAYEPSQSDSIYSAVVHRLIQMHVMLPEQRNSYCLVFPDGVSPEFGNDVVALVVVESKSPAWRYWTRMASPVSPGVFRFRSSSDYPPDARVLVYLVRR